MISHRATIQHKTPQLTESVCFKEVCNIVSTEVNDEGMSEKGRYEQCALNKIKH
jgi:hypothetical protein